MSLPLDIRAIIESAIQAVTPREIFARSLSMEAGMLRVHGVPVTSPAPERLFVVGAGKAAGTMANAFEAVAGSSLTGGCVVTPYGHAVPCERVQVLEGGHPVVDELGLAATQAVLRVAESAGDRDLVVCLLSGGASALLEQLPEGISLADLQETTRLLLASGVSIDEFNTVRRHLSLVKGGQLARKIAPARCVSLVISDVIGDVPEAIASGPTVPDPSTFASACLVLERAALMGRVPEAVRRHLQDGVRGLRAETPKTNDAVFAKTSYHVLANNAAALEAAAREAAARGYGAHIVDPALRGEARDAGRTIAAAVRSELARERERLHRAPGDRPVCLLWGGETTITLRGRGRGGRNQELVLAALDELGDTEGSFAVAAVGTDGTDGPTDAAGAWFDRAMIHLAREKGIRAADYLAENDSFSFFRRMGGHLRTGPTGTNVADLALALVGRVEPVKSDSA